MAIDLKRTKPKSVFIIHNNSAPSPRNKKPITWWVEEQVAKGEWREVTLLPGITGLDHPVNIFETERHSSFIKPWQMSQEDHLPPFAPQFGTMLRLVVVHADCSAAVVS